MRDYERIKALLNKIAATGTGSIRSDDPDALAKLKSKLVSLEQSHADMKAVNAYYHKHKTLDGCPGLTDEMRRALERYTDMGFIPTYRLSYNLAEIKRVKQRIAELEHRAENPFQGWTFDGGEVVANAEANRLQIIFADKPDASRPAQKARFQMVATLPCVATATNQQCRPRSERDSDGESVITPSARRGIQCQKGCEYSN